MSKRFVASTILFAIVVSLASFARAQQDNPQDGMRLPGAVYDFDKKGEKPKPAPKHDISGVWEPAAGYNDGVAATGAKAMPSDGKPEHELPYTAEGRKTFMANKPTFGVTQVPAALTNDPVPACNPQGFPRILLHNYRTSRIVQTPDNILFLYEFNQKFRVIWTDGRQLPKDPQNPTWGAPDPPESRWWGYAVGKWVDDYTFVAESTGFDDRTWLDNVGRPHSDLLRVTEQYRRTDLDHLEITVTIDDPKMYTKPWVALRLRERLQKNSFDIHEMECAPMETDAYNKDVADPAVDK